MHTNFRLLSVVALTSLPLGAACAGADDPGAVGEGAVTVVAPTQGRGSLASRIRALPGGGSDAWDRAVGVELVSAYDKDRSGALDASEEVDAVPCEVWAAIDDGVLTGWGRGVWVIYGFAPDRAWVGDAIRVSEGVRQRGAERLKGCGLASEAPAVAPTAEAMPARLGALPAGGSDLWDVAVRGLVLSVYDRDDSGAVDTDAEVAGVGCDTWRALDAGVRRGWPTGLWLTYGFAPPMLYLGDVLGFSLGVREVAAASLAKCGLQEQPPDGEPAPVGSEVFRVVVQQVPASSPGWDGFVREMLTRLYDQDRDALIDEPDEARGIGCDVWQTLDEVVRRDRGRGLYDAYGFDPDGAWSGDALGVATPLRAIVADRLLTCGAGPQAAVTDFVAGSSTATLAPELARYDQDRSGRLDTDAELRAVPCDAWARLEQRAQGEVGLGVVDRYGLARGTLWTGDAIGLSPSLRQEARRAVEACVKP